MFAAEKAIVCGKGTGVWGGKHMVDGICNKALLFFGGISPKQKYYWTASVVQMGNNTIGEDFPALAPVGICRPCPYGKDGV